jgi:hypothetical protein
MHLATFSLRNLCSKMGLDESQRLRAVLVGVLLVRVGIVAVAAVWVGRVAVRLDLGSLGAGEALGASSELITCRQHSTRTNEDQNLAIDLLLLPCRCQHCTRGQQRCVGRP